MKQLGFIFNPDKCIKCRACEIACKNENYMKGKTHWKRLIKLDVHEFVPISCNHCQIPECSRVCPENAFIKRLDGIVTIDESRCSGCGLCVTACPFQAIMMNYETTKVSKCQMCSTRIDEDLLPSCVTACSTNALTIEDLYSIDPVNYSRKHKDYPNTLLTNPSIIFKKNAVKQQRKFFIE